MSPMPLKLDLPMQSLKKFLRIYAPSSEHSPDDWASQETATVKVGDIYTIFQPARLFSEKDDMSELEVAGVALVFREDAGFPMNYFMDNTAFEMSFMEGVLSSKAGEAKEQGLAFYCFHSTLSKPLTSDAATALGGMHKWGGAGDRSKAPHGLSDPLYFFLSSLGIGVDPASAKDPLPIADFVLSMWNAAALAPKSRAAKLDGWFTALEGSGLNALLAESPENELKSEPAAEVKEEVNYNALSFSALLDDLATPTAGAHLASKPVEPSGDNGGHNLPQTASPVAALGEDGRLSELLGKVASGQASSAAPAPVTTTPEVAAHAPDAPAATAPATAPAAAAAANADLSPAEPAASSAAAPPAPNPFAAPAPSPFPQSANPFASASTTPNPFTASPTPTSAAAPAPNPFAASAPVPNPFSTPLPSANEAPQSAASTPAVSSPAAIQGSTEDDEDESLDLASLENALKGLVTQPSTKTSPESVPDSKPAPGRRTALGPQFEDSEGAWEMLKAKPTAAEKPSSAASPASPASGTPSPNAPAPAMAAALPDGLDFGAALAAELNAEVTLALPGSEPPTPAPAATKGMEPWPSDFAAAMKAELAHEPPTAKPATKGMEPWPTDFAAALKAELAPEPQAPASKPASKGMEPWPTDFAAAMKAELAPDATAPSQAALQSGIESVLPAPPVVSSSAPLPDKTVEIARPDYQEAMSKELEPSAGASSLDKLLGGATEEPFPADFASMLAAELNAELGPAEGAFAGASLMEPFPTDLASALAAELSAPVESGELPAEDPTAIETIALAAETSAPAAEQIAPNTEPIASDAESIAPAAESTEPAAESIAPAAQPALALDAVAPPVEKPATVGGMEPWPSDFAAALASELNAELPPREVPGDDLLADSSAPVAEPKPASAPSAESTIPAAQASSADGIADLLLAQAPKTQSPAPNPFAPSTPLTPVTPEPLQAKAEDIAKQKLPASGKPPSVPLRGKTDSPASAKPGAVSSGKIPLTGKVQEPAAAASGQVDLLATLLSAGAVKPNSEAAAQKLAQDLGLPAPAPGGEVGQSEEETASSTPAASSIIAPAEISAPTSEAPSASPTPSPAAGPGGTIGASPSPAASGNSSADKFSTLADKLKAYKISNLQDKAKAPEATSAEAPALIDKPLLSSSKLKKESAPGDLQAIDDVLGISAASKVPIHDAQTHADSEMSSAQVADAQESLLIEVKGEEPSAEPQSEPAPAAKVKVKAKSGGKSPSDLLALEDDDEDDSKPQKKLSLQATLAKLEEQSARANVRLNEFKKAHEAACNEDMNAVKGQSEEYQIVINENLAEIRQSVLAKLKVLSEEASKKLADFVAEGQKQIEERKPLAIGELDQIASEVDTLEVNAELQNAANSFLSICKERVGGLEEEQSAALDTVLQEELKNLEGWRKGQLKTFMESFEQILARVEQQRIASLSALESCVHSLSEELQRLEEIDLQRLALLNSELAENLQQACKLAEMRLTRHCDMALAEQILPLLAEWKGSLSLKARKLRMEIEEQLEGHSEASLADFEPVLSLGKEAVTLIVSNVSELKENIEINEKEALDKKLSALSKHFDKKLDELSKFFKEQKKKESSGAASQESDSVQRLDKIAEACIAKIEDFTATSGDDLRKQSETAIANFEIRADDVGAAALAEMSQEVETVRNHRRESVRKLQEKLSRVSATVQALQAQLIQ